MSFVEVNSGAGWHKSYTLRYRRWGVCLREGQSRVTATRTLQRHPRKCSQRTWKV